MTESSQKDEVRKSAVLRGDRKEEGEKKGSNPRTFFAWRGFTVDRKPSDTQFSSHYRQSSVLLEGSGFTPSLSSFLPSFVLTKTSLFAFSLTLSSSRRERRKESLLESRRRGETGSGCE